jgi:hypothetical protein
MPEDASSALEMRGNEEALIDSQSHTRITPPDKL